MISRGGCWGQIEDGRPGPALAGRVKQGGANYDKEGNITVQIRDMEAGRESNSLLEFERAQFIQDEKVKGAGAFEQRVSPFQCLCYHLPASRVKVIDRLAPAIRQAATLPAGEVEQVNADFLLPVYHRGRDQSARIHAEQTRLIGKTHAPGGLARAARPGDQHQSGFEVSRENKTRRESTRRVDRV